MNREDMIKAGAAAARRNGVGSWEHLAEVVLDAVLPQITTAEEVRALPDCTVLMFPVHGGVWFVEILGGRLQALSSGGVEDPDWYLSRYGPLTVVWQPS